MPEVLSGGDREALCSALVNAFRSRSDFELLLQFELSASLAAIVEDGSTTEIAFRLINYYESRSELARLVAAACRRRPSDATLGALLIKVGGVPGAVPGPPAMPVAAQGLLALASLMSDGRVRDAVARFSGDFQAACEQIELVASYKDMHDLLHTVQFQCLSQVVREAQRFPDDLDGREILVHHQIELKTLSDRLGQVAAHPCLKTRPTTTLWIGEVSAAAAELQTALTTIDAGVLRRAVQRLERVTSQRPAHINACLNEAARALRLPALVAALTQVAERFDGEGFEPDTVETFQGGLATLRMLESRFATLVTDHDHWQALDVELHRLRTSLRAGTDELTATWASLAPLWAAVFSSRADWVAACEAEVRGVDDALASADVPRLRMAFQRCYSVAVDRFYLVDRELKDLCAALRDVGRPLSAVLDMLG